MTEPTRPAPGPRARPNVMIQVNPECMSLLETKLVEGRLCLVVPVDDQVEVNGLPVRTLVNREG